jgi:hypothetical protein
MSVTCQWSWYPLTGSLEVQTFTPLAVYLSPATAQSVSNTLVHLCRAESASASGVWSMWLDVQERVAANGMPLSLDYEIPASQRAPYVIWRHSIRPLLSLSTTTRSMINSFA